MYIYFFLEKLSLALFLFIDLVFQSLHKLWDSVNGESLQRRKHIQDLDETYQKYESERAVMIGGILKRYTKMLERISYLMPADIHRLIDKEAMMINQALLANRRAVGRLFVNLVESNLQKELSRRLSWEGRLQDWKKIKIQASIDQFKVFMNSQRVQNPEAVQRTLASVRKAQQSLTERRMSTLQSLSSSIKPPVCTKAVVSEWYSSLSAVNEQIDTLHVDTVTALRSSYERVWQDCLAEIEKFKEEVSACALTELEIQSIVTRELLPLVGASQSQEEARLEDMDKAFEEQAQRARAQSKALFKFTQGAAHLWELHSARLQRQEQLLQYQLDEVRHAHDQDNQRRMPLPHSVTAFSYSYYGYIMLIQLPIFALRCLSVSGFQKGLRWLKVAGFKRLMAAEFYKIYNFIGACFCVVSPLQGKEASLDIIMDKLRQESTEEALKTALEKALNFLEEIKKGVRLAFFEHLEDRYETIPTNSVNIVAAKKDELKSELELRLHLHQPRAKRIEMDIHNVRSGESPELVLHRDRVERHCKGITEALNALKTEFVALRDEQKKLTEDFRTHIYSMENVFINASKSSVLVGLCSSLHTDLDKHLGLIQTSLRQYRQKLESTLGRLRESNAEFIKSFRLPTFITVQVFCPLFQAVTPDDLHVFTQFIMEELKKRCQYLECLTDLFSTALAPEAPLQGPIAAAARTETLKLEKLGAHSTDSLLQPSKMGRPATEDVAVGVIQHILQIQKYKDSPDFQGEPVERSQTVTAALLFKSFGVRLLCLKPDKPGRQCNAGILFLIFSLVCLSVKRFSKPTRFDKRFQVFGPKPEQQPVTFKGVINSVLWKANDVLLAVAEDFYKKKERRAITRPQYLQETFEHCAEVLNSKLLSYQSQTLAYHNACLQGQPQPAIGPNQGPAALHSNIVARIQSNPGTTCHCKLQTQSLVETFHWEQARSPWQTTGCHQLLV
ncbi:CC180 protein, partial [Amia calva]|nr:CC180 protein [Amia calva]